MAKKVHAEPYEPSAGDRKAPQSNDYAHHFISSIHDLRNSVDRLNDSVKEMSDALDAATESQRQMMEVLSAVTQNLNLARGVGKLVHSFLAPRPRNPR